MSINIEYHHLAIRFTPQRLAAILGGQGSAIRLPAEPLFLVFVLHGNNRLFDVDERGRHKIAREVSALCGGTAHHVEQWVGRACREADSGCLQLASSRARTQASTYRARYRRVLREAIDASDISQRFDHGLVGRLWSIDAEHAPVTSLLEAAGIATPSVEPDAPVRCRFRAAPGAETELLLAVLALRAQFAEGYTRADVYHRRELENMMTHHQRQARLVKAGRIAETPASTRPREIRIDPVDFMRVAPSGQRSTSLRNTRQKWLLSRKTRCSDPASCFPHRAG